MKVLHVPFTYYPDPCGGTEVYVRSLVDTLKPLGIECVIAAPGKQVESYKINECEVYRFDTSKKLTTEMMYGMGDPLAAEKFGIILNDTKPNLVHFHSFTSATSVLALRECQARGIRAITTYHTPTQSCIRGTMMKMGNQPCDGVLRVTRCSTCFLCAQNIPRPAADLFTLASPFLQYLTWLPGLSDGKRTGLSVKAVVNKRHTAIKQWWNGLNAIVALCKWSRELLLRNKVPAEKLRLVRHGLPVSSDFDDCVPVARNGQCRLVFLGRLDHTKGIDLIIEAIRQVPDWQFQLDLYVIRPTKPELQTEKLVELVQSDRRIRLCDPIEPQKVVKLLTSYDALLVPSRWMETGPLVVLEAYAAGVPVIGSKLGGIAEWVEDGVNGLLVESITVDAWKKVFTRLKDDPKLLKTLKSNVQAPPAFSRVASEMKIVYEETLAQSN